MGVADDAQGERLANHWTAIELRDEKPLAARRNAGKG
jgi:hypothetical protein